MHRNGRYVRVLRVRISDRKGTPMTTLHVRSPVLILVQLVSLTHANLSFSPNALASTPASPAPVRGQLLANPPALLGSYSGSELIAKATDGTVSQWLLKKTFSPQCSVNVYKLQYVT